MMPKEVTFYATMFLPYLTILTNFKSPAMLKLSEKFIQGARFFIF